MLLGRALRPWFSWRARGKVAVLAYHNIVPDGEVPGGDRSLHLARPDFAAQLDALIETHRVVPLDRVVDAAHGGQRDGGRPLAALTFDDAYRGAMTCGLDELEARGLPATVFVSPGLLGDDGFWWDRIAWPEFGPTSRSGSQPDRKQLLDEAGGRRQRILDRARSEGWLLESRPPEHARPVTESELRSVATRPGVTMGAHGWSHPNLAALDAEERREELERPLARLRELVGEVMRPLLAYPYGRWDQATARAAEEVGYSAAFRVSGGLLDPGACDLYRLPRTNIPAGASTEGFRLRALGVVA